MASRRPRDLEPARPGHRHLAGPPGLRRLRVDRAEPRSGTRSPRTSALLIVAGPKSPFKPEEVAKLKAYADRGGPVLALVGNTEPAGLDDFFKSFNLEIGRGLVIDPGSTTTATSSWSSRFLKGGPGHPITDGLQADRAVLVPNGAPIQILGQGPTGPSGHRGPRSIANLVPIAILRTGPQSWAETDLTNPRPRLDEGADEPGPMTVGVAVQERAPGRDGRRCRCRARSRSPGSSCSRAGRWPTTIVQGIEPTNLDLVMNAASWLRGRPDAIGIAAKTHVALTLTADPAAPEPADPRPHRHGRPWPSPRWGSWFTWPGASEPVRGGLRLAGG